MPRISSRPWLGQIGGAQQTSDIEMAAGTSVNLRRGSGTIELHCQNNTERLEVYSDGYGAYRDIGARSANFTNSVDITSDLNSFTAFAWVLNV